MDHKDKLLKIIVDTGTEMAAEAVVSVLTGMGIGNVAFEERELNLGFTRVNGFVEPALAGLHLPAGRFKGLVAEIYRRISDLEKFDIFVGDHEIRCQLLDQEDWAESWKRYFKPLRIGRRFIIAPSWEKVDASPEDLVITIDPGTAFGTGQHPTTALCLRAIERAGFKEVTALDLGCGSGILSIAMAMLGATVVAIDNDPDAVGIAGENVKAHGLGDRVEVLCGNLLDPVKGKGRRRFGMVVANILSHVVLQAAPGVAEILDPGGFFIASGIIDSANHGFISQVSAMGYSIVEVCREAEWYQVTMAIPRENSSV